MSKNMHEVAAELAKLGRGGDSILAHINKTEAAVLKSLGGAGSINPKTGLLEFNGNGGGGNGPGDGGNGGGPGGAGPGAGGASQGGGSAGTGGTGSGSGAGGGKGGRGVGGGFGPGKGTGSGTGAGGGKGNPAVGGGFGAAGQAAAAEAAASKTDRSFSFDAIARSFGITEEQARAAALDPTPAVGTPGFGLSVDISRALAESNPIAAGITEAIGTAILGAAVPGFGLAKAVAGIATGRGLTGIAGQVASAIGVDVSGKAPAPASEQSGRGENAGKSGDGPGGSGDSNAPILNQIVDALTAGNTTDETAEDDTSLAEALDDLLNDSIFNFGDFPDFELLDPAFGDTSTAALQKKFRDKLAKQRALLT